MKLDRIAVRGFLSHRETDWAPDGARLAAIVGPNGAGKSSLLDAVMYALFDSARGRTDELVRLGESEMAAMVEFGYAGGRYRVTRGRTTRSGGKSYLELHVADGDGWRPLTGDSIRETQAKIEELLRMDAATFQTAAWLMQGRANAFAEATAAERKRILATVLGLDVYERAEARTREQARDVERGVEARELQLFGIEQQLTLRAGFEEELGRRRSESAALEEHVAETQRALEQRRADLAESDAKIRESSAAGDDVARLERELEEHADRWRRADRARRAAEQQLEAAEAVLRSEGAVREASEELERVRGRLAELDKVEFRRRGLVVAVNTARELVSRSELVHGAAIANWRAESSRVHGIVRELESQAAQLKPVTCPECGTEFPADPAGIGPRLERGRAAVAALPGEPAPPAELVDARSALQAAVAALEAAPYDAEEHDALRRRVVDLERIAARAGEVDQARQMAAQARQAAQDATEEAARAEEAGRTARAALDEARTRHRALETLRMERASIAASIVDLEADLRQLADRQRASAAAIARAEAALEQLAQVEEERDRLAGLQEVDRREIALLRRLVTAFGVTGIPARIIESVLPELSRHANELLSQLRPGMQLAIRAQRAKKSGSGVVEALDLVVRDDVGERPLQLFSGGERMSVSLALAVGLSRLVARRAGTAIRTLVVDEPDGLDADARRAFGQALRILAHAGELERVVVVSHHADLADFGDAVYQVSRNGSGSVVERVA